jgi:hypothetical protein
MFARILTQSCDVDFKAVGMSGYSKLSKDKLVSKLRNS